MSWHDGGPVPEADDYRALAFETTVSQLAKQGGGVVVLGVSRSGKTTLLHRLLEHRALGAKSLIDLSLGATTVFELLKDEVQGLLLDEGHVLTRWTDADVLELRKRLKGRPFVMASWPSIRREDASPELQRLLEDARSIPLPLLSLEETGHMVRCTRSPVFRDCGQDVVESIHQAAAGLPYLVARLCLYLVQHGHAELRVLTEELQTDFLDLLGDNGNPFKLIYQSLPPRMQQLLDDHRDGKTVQLSSLREYGLASGTPARLEGALFTRIWSRGSTWVSVTSSGGPTPRHAPPRPRPVFSWLQLSDLHFGAGSPAHVNNQQAVLENLRRDVQTRKVWTPDLILITGDIAFSAKPEEYASATRWLKTLVEAAGTSMDALRLVPGNHDVDRSRADAPVVGSIHHAIRAAPEKLDTHLDDEESRNLLARKLETYIRFVKDAVPAHPLGEKDSILDWREVRPASPELPGRLFIVGLCSVWVSDKQDGERKLLLSEQQLRVLNDVREEDLLLVLTHHPPGWLHTRSEELLLDRMAERAPHIHLCGHVHNAKASALRSFGTSRDSLRIVAGASHGEDSEQHGYAWGALRWSDKTGWEIGWAPRIIVKGRGVRPDSLRYNLDADGYAWEPLKELKWPALGAQAAQKLTG
jgi:predicted MPP superfamily phosphohydrolase